MKKALISMVCLLVLFIGKASADQADLISIFPMDHYDQTISAWFKPTDPNYDKPILDASTQQKHFDLFYQYTFGKDSPWDANTVNTFLHTPQPKDLYTYEKDALVYFSNDGKSADDIGYGENYIPYPPSWIQNIANNIDLSSLQKLNFTESNRAIAIKNAAVRILPTNDVFLYSFKLPGQGYPFDNLQVSAVWVGSPLYIISKTRDLSWTLVMGPDFAGWVPSNSITHASLGFVNAWSGAAQKNLAAITREQTPVLDSKNHFMFTAYVGTVFPAILTGQNLKILVPTKNKSNQAEIHFAKINKDNASLMPLVMTEHNIANIMSSMIGRPYGWGSMYFYNDCSAETKSFMTPFGIWLPRHSSSQVNVGRMVDMSNASPQERLSYLMQNGKPFLNVVYIGGHIFLYVGNFPNPNSASHEPIAMTYQDVWGLSPYPSTRRAVIGKSVLFPLLLQYPEDKSLMSLAAKKYFQIAFLNDLSANPADIYKLQLKDLLFPTST